MNIEINGCKWNIINKPFTSLEKADGDYTRLGLCNFSDKEIFIDKSLPSNKHMEVVVHEILHACLPQTAEYAIEHAGEKVAEALRKYGYGRTKRR